MTKAARDYVGSQDAIVKTLIPAMQTAYNSGATTADKITAATPGGLDILAQIAKDRLTASQIGTNAQGAILVNDVISAKCSDILNGVSTQTLAEFDLTGIEAALAAGVFEVRGDVPALAAVAFVPATTGGRAEASPRWGVIPAAGCSTTDPFACSWPELSSTQKRYLLIAFPTTADLGGETPAITTALGSANGFTVGMMPDISDKSLFRVGICISPIAKDGNGNPIGANLGLHDNKLLVTYTSTICSGYPTQTMLENKTWFASLTQRAASWLSPSTLFAQSRDDSGDWVGPTGWSPVTFAQITGTGTSLSFVSIPKTGTVGVAFELQVLAGTANHSVPGVLVTISLANNSGAPAGAVIINDATALTGPDGIAHVKVIVNKAGGYTFFASGSLASAPTNTIVSTQVLNVKNAK